MSDPLREILRKVQAKSISKDEAVSLIRQLRTAQPAGARPELLYFRPAWDRLELGSPPEEGKPSGPGLWIGEETDASFRGDGAAEVYYLRPGGDFLREEGNRFRLGADFRQGLRMALAVTGAPSRVFFEWHGGVEGGAVERIFSLAQELIAAKLKQPVPIVLWTPDAPSPAFAACAGMARTLAVEHSLLKMVALAGLARGFPREGPEAEVMYREGRRFVRRFEAVDAGAEVRRTPWRVAGRYLITGGAGGIGLSLARYLCSTYRARVILAGRSELDQERNRILAETRSLGGEVVYLRGDVSRRDEAERLAVEARAQFGGVDGVIHAAGVTRDGYLAKKTETDLRAVLAPKVFGVMNLDEALRDEPLDFFAAFSSVAAVLANPGQTDYAYANRFMDAYLVEREERRRRGERQGRSVSINWPLWAEGGMDAPLERKAALAREFGLHPMPSEDGFRALSFALGGNDPNLTVLYGERARVESWLPLAASRPDDSSSRALSWLVRLYAEESKFAPEELDTDERLQRYGIDSILIHRLNQRLEGVFGPVSKTLFFEHQTLRQVSEHLAETYPEKWRTLWERGGGEQGTRKSEPSSAPANQAVARGAKPPRCDDIGGKDEIAIIGLSGRYPGAEDLEAFWENLKRGVESIGVVPAGRWDWREYFDPEITAGDRGKSYGKWGGFLSEADCFDPLFFRISPREAEAMDPQERLFLETAWATLEDAGYTPAELNAAAVRHGKSVGVFAGVTKMSYLLHGPEQWARGNPVVPNSLSWSVANRVSHLFDFNGPSLPVDTACSASLTAIHLACESLRRGECAAALAGGVNLYLHPSTFVGLCQMRMLSIDGKNRSFGEGGNGFVPGEGVGAVLLKPLRQALDDGDHIYGVIQGSAVNHGGRTNGYSVPNPNAQAALVRDALDKAGARARDVGFIEAHGTGTALGDPVEISGLTRAFRQETADCGFCAISSVKSNIGHLEAAAGIAALTKTLLQMRHEKLVPSLHADPPNPRIDFLTTPFKVQRQLEDWRPSRVGRLLAGISSFGAGGANAHVVVASWKPEEQTAEANPLEPRLILLSARTSERLTVVVERLAGFLRRSRAEGRIVAVRDLAHALKVGREAMEERLAVIARGDADLLDRLERIRAGGEEVEDFFRGRKSGAKATFDARGRSLQETAAAWVAGADVLWFAEEIEPGARRISLPTYPFARDRHWIPILAGRPTEALHPLLDRNASTLDEQKFFKSLGPDEFIVREHVVAGAKVLPGAACLEMARAAGDFSKEEGRVNSLSRVVWSRPIRVVDTPLPLRIGLTPRENGARFDIWTEFEGSRVSHVQGKLSFGPPGTRPAPLELAEIEARMTRHFDRAAIYGSFHEAGIVYGPAFQNLADLRVNDHEALARIRLTDDVQARAGRYTLHPLVLDAAFQCVLGFGLGPGRGASKSPVLPFELDELTFFGELPAVGRAFVVEAGPGSSTSRSYDLTLTDEQGGVLVLIKGFKVRGGVERQTAPPAFEAGFFSPVWRLAVPSSVGTAVSPGSLVVLTEDPARMVAVREAGLRRGFQRIVQVKRGKTIRRLEENVFELAPEDPGDFASLFKGMESASAVSVLDLWLLDRADPDFIVTAKTAFVLAQGLMASGRGAARVIHAHRDSLAGSLSGFFKAARIEHPGLRQRAVEIGGLDEAGLVEAVLNEVVTEGEETEIRYRAGERQARQMENLTAVAGPSSLLTPDGVFLVTGGLGELGRAVAGHLVARFQARVMLVGRSTPSPADETWMASLSPLGGGIKFIQGDVARLEDATRAVEETLRVFGVIHGVVHLAGVLRDGRLSDKSAAEIETVLRPKVLGAVNLDTATRNQNLTRFILFSSIAGELGSAGQTDYACANAFLDRFAAEREERRARGERSGRTVSIIWPWWVGGGMKMDPGRVEWLRSTWGLEPLETEAGLKLFESALACDAAQVLVLYGRAARFKKLFSVAESADARPVSKGAPVEGGLEPRLQERLRQAVAAQLKVDPDDVENHEDFSAYGFDSISLTNFSNQLNQTFGIETTPALFFECPTVLSLSKCLLERFGDRMRAGLGGHAVAAEAKVVSAATRFSLRPKPHAQTGAEGGGAIAVIGMDGRFPGAPTLGQFWKNMEAGLHSVTEAPVERWDWRLYQPAARWGGFIEDVDKFDAAFFGISPREAELMDPQQRLFLETAWNTLENAGYPADPLLASRTGLFVGVATRDYAELAARLPRMEAHTATGLSHSILANRVSYLLNLTGPSEAIDTACSSSLVALHRAVRSLRARECDLALAGGVNAVLTPSTTLGFVEAGMLCESGRCRTFDAQAGGYVRGEGVAAVLLKRLDEAVRDGDVIHGVIRGTAVNHGGRVNSLTAPNPNAQAAVIREALEDAGVLPETVSYIEAHGTGTPLGDPVEVNALKQVFKERPPGAAWPDCGLGSVKTNIGHLESAAGIAGVIKALLALRHGRIPASLHFNRLNPYIQFEGSPFYVVRETKEWTRSEDGSPRRAGVSSFGFGGANAHVSLEEFAAPAPAKVEPGWQLFTLSAKTEQALSRRITELAGWLAAGPGGVRLESVAYTLSVGRLHLPKRRAVLAKSVGELSESLATLARGERPANCFEGEGARLKAEEEAAGRRIWEGLAPDFAGRPDRGSEVWREKLATLAGLYVKGLEIDWKFVHAGARGRVALPGYPFQKDRHWIHTPALEGLVEDGAARASTPPAGMPAVPVSGVGERLLEELRAEAAGLLKLPGSGIDCGANLTSYGFDSILLKEFARKINERCALDFAPNIFFTHTSLAAVRDYLMEKVPSIGRENAPPRSPGLPRRGKAQEGGLTDGSVREAPQQTSPDAIVIVGMSGRFPGSPDLEMFWRNLEQGADLITEIPPDRFDWRQAFEKGTGRGAPIAKWGGFISDADKFDAAFFGISPREAELMDPQHRLLLQCAWHAVESAGESPSSLSSRPVGVLVGIEFNDYLDLIAEAGASHTYSSTGNGHAMAANRISHCLNLRGPSEAVDTACSSSLVALHRAVGLLQRGDCESALVGGVSLMLSPKAFIGTSQMGVLSPDGRCKTFDASANGYVRGEGVGMLYLMRLAEAERRGLPVLAVIRGAGVGHGGQGQSLTAPNAQSQAELLASVYRAAGVETSSIGYIEAHGTGTELGDPVEFDGLREAFAAAAGAGVEPPRSYCGLGSVKTNIGHLEAAAGVAGVIKVILALRNKTLPASLHLKRINPFIKIEGSPFFIVEGTRAWPQLSDASANPLPRRAGVSSFGFGGANAHVLLEEFLPFHSAVGPEKEGWRLATLSARSEAALRQRVRDLAVWLAGAGTGARLEEIALTLNEGRPGFDWRLAVVARTPAVLLEALSAWTDGGAAPDVLTGRKGSGDEEPALKELMTHLLSSLRAAPEAAAGERREKLLALGDLYVKGYKVDWTALRGSAGARRLSLPVYPFEGRRFWVPTAEAATGRAVVGKTDEENSPRKSAAWEGQTIVFAPRWKWVVSDDRTKDETAGKVGAVWIVHHASSLVAARELAAGCGPGEGVLFGSENIAPIEERLRAKENPESLVFLSGAPTREEDLISLFRLTRVLIRNGFAARSLVFTVLTRSVGGKQEDLTPEAAALHGLAQVAAAEHPSWTVGCFDADGETNWQAGRFLPDALGSGPVGQRPSPSVLVRAGCRFVRELAPIQFGNEESDPFKTHGVYFIAGGAGGLGLQLSLHLAARYRARLVWTGRRKLDAAIEGLVEQVRKAGGEALYLQADINDMAQLAEAAREARMRFGGVHGVFHSAVSLRDRLIGRLEEEDFDAGLAALTRGSANLAEVFAEDCLDFMVFFSTSAVFAAREGIAAYTTGSAYKDALALALSGRRSYPVRVINWGYWGAIGLGALDGLMEGFARAGILPLTVEEAMRVVSRAISSAAPQLVCIRADEEVLLRMGVKRSVALRMLKARGTTPGKMLEAVGKLESPVLDAAAADRLGRAFARLTGFAHRLLIDSFRRMGAGWTAGESFAPAELREKMGVAPEYFRLFDSLLKMLADAGFLAGDERRMSVTFPEQASVSEEVWSEEAREIAREFPEVAPHLELLRVCVGAYPEVLTGRRHPIEVMFPGGSAHLVEGIYQGNVLADFHHRRIADALRWMMLKAAETAGAGTFRVIEAGAGTGGLTGTVLAVAGELAGKIRYDFTDVSKAFLERGRQRLGGRHPCLNFKLLDLERDPEEQGFAIGAADVVLCSNVLHAVRRLGPALRRLKGLLRPGGVILIHEVMSLQDFSTLTFGLTEGWWHFEDGPIRIPGSPMLNAAAWRALCLENGFRHARVLGLPGDESHETAEGVLMAESDGVIFEAEKSGGDAETRGHGDARMEPAEPAPVSRNARVGVAEGLRSEASMANVREYVRTALATVMKLPNESIEDEVTFDAYGVDSLIVLELKAYFEKDLGPVPAALLFDKFNVVKLAGHFAAKYPARFASGKSPGTAPGEPGGVASPVHSGESLPKIGHRPSAIGNPDEIGPIAIIGLSGVYPGAENLEDFWNNLRAGKSGVTEIPASRWDWRAYFDPDPERSDLGRCYVKWGAFLEDFDKFDPLFFNISPREAEATDPQERLFLQTAWSVIEDAGYAPRGLRESAEAAGGNVGVFVGVTKNSYQLNGPDQWARGNPVAANSLPWSIANRVSYAFDFQGPSMPIDTACSSSLTAIHAACESIRHGECVVALAGGVNLYLHPSTFVALCQMRMLSPDGVCRSYGRGANGFVPGEGVGAVLLKPLARAQADDDHIYGVIKSTAVNHGGRTKGYTVPNPSAHAALIRRALDRAGVPARSISYLEGHGTGTALGDPIEVEALTRVFQGETAETGFCRIGSLKSNIGHAESAAGIAGVTKVLLQMKHRRIAPSLHAEETNPLIDFEAGPFRLQKSLEEWRTLEDFERAGGQSYPLRAGVSSFGAGGSNAHVILEEAPASVVAAEAGSRPRLIVLSARTDEQLKICAQRLLAHWEGSGSGSALAGVAFTLQTGREPMDERLAFTAADLAEARGKLRNFLEGRNENETLWRGRAGRPSASLRLLLDGEDGATLVRRMLERGELEKCARLWTDGVFMDWRLLYAVQPQRVSLPTYPFKKDRYWLTEATAPQKSAIPLAAPFALHPVWKALPLVGGSTRNGDVSRVVVWCRDESCAREISASGLFDEVIWVRPGAAFARVEAKIYEVRIDSAADYQLLCADLFERGRAEQFVSIMAAANPDPTGANLEEGLKEVLFGPHLFLQALIRRSGQAALNWIMVSLRAGGGLNPLHGLAAGYIKALRLEHPSVDARWISVDESGSGALARILEGEFHAGPDAGGEIRHEGGARFAREMELCPDSRESGVAVRVGGRYLITGGAGGLGLIFAEHFLSKFRGRLILAGRSPLSRKKRARLDQLAALGGEARYLRADVSIREEASRVAREAESAYGGLDGVIHAAGVMDYGKLVDREPAAMRRVLAPKVDGTLWLDEATRDQELDFFVLFSSLSSVAGVSEAADYAAANAFLDHFAAWREGRRAAGTRRGKSVAINWPHWKEGGMKFADPVMAENWEAWMRRVQGLEMLGTESGLAAFHEALRGAEAQRCVIQGDLARARAMLRRAAGLAAGDTANNGEKAQNARVADEGGPIRATRKTGEWPDKLEAELIALVGELLKVKPADVNIEANLSEFGFDSITLKSLTDRVNARFGLGLMPSVFFSHASLLAFKGHLTAGHADAIRQRYQDCGEELPAPVRIPPMAGEPKSKEPGSPLPGVSEDEIAVVGMSGVFPGSPDVETFWRHLEKGEDLIREVPPERWNWREVAAAENGSNKPSRWGGFIQDVDAFDAEFFGVQALEAERMDPQHRLFLREAWRAVESAGESPAALSGRRVGVFAGVQFRDYEGMLARQGISDAYTATGNGHAMLANRVSFLLNLQGPSEAVDTACSSSLVALNRAVAALQRGECVSAIAGGVSLLLSPDTSIGAGRLAVLSPDGRCKTFDASANGYVKGEGVGVLFLMRLKEAASGGYPIRGLIRGAGVNHGGRAQSLTAPNTQAQRDLLVEAYTRAKVAPETVGMIEVHGTGTELGDPVEFNGLKEAFATLAARFKSPVGGTPSCGLGSVKSNIGHLEPAAGIAGVIKVLLAFRHQTLPPTLHVRKINPYIELGGTPFYLVTEARRWEPVRDAEGRVLPRRAGVSSFGFGGANAHVILEEFSADNIEKAPAGPRLVVLSAKNAPALSIKAAELRAWLEARVGWEDLGALSHTLAAGRSHFRERAALVVNSISGLRQALAGLEGGGAVADVWRGSAGRRSETERREWADWQSSRAGAARPGPTGYASAETLRELARRYVAGYEIVWEYIFEPAATRRLELPGYPFRNDRYWIPRPRVATTPPRPPEVSSPPLFEQVETLASGRRFVKTLHPGEFHFADHVVGGVRTLPGVAYLEFARAAAAEWNGAGPMTTLRHIVWARPMQARDEPVSMRVELTRHADHFGFEVLAKEAGRDSVSKENGLGSILHAQGKVAFGAVASAQTERFDADRFAGNCAQHLDKREIYEAFRRVGLDYGPGFQALEWIKAGAEGAMGLLRLPSILVGAPDRSRFVLHPSLMDGALQTILGLEGFEGRKDAALTVPFGIDEVVIYDSLPDTCFVLARESERSNPQSPRKHEFRIFNEAGGLVCAIHGFMTRELTAGRAQSSFAGDQTRFYLPTWVAAPASEPTAFKAGAKLLLFDNDDARRAAVQARFAGNHERVAVTQVRAGAAFEARADGSFVIRAEEVEDYDRLLAIVLQAGEAECLILQLWPLAGSMGRAGDVPAESWLREVRVNFTLTQALQRRGVKSVRLVCACRREGAASAGFAKCLLQENGRYRQRVVEVGETDGERLTTGLLGELRSEDAPVEIRWNGTERLVKTLAPRAAASNGRHHARPPVCLISGGLGGLGRLVAEHLAKTDSARIVLAGRSALTDGGREFLERLRGLGGEGVYIQADVATDAGAEAVTRAALERFGALDYVFHAAGIIRDGFILRKSPADFEEVLRVKALGAIYLDRATSALPLEHFVLFSSVASVLGNLGQGDYAAANGFLDSFARWREARREGGERQGKTVSINWPLWREGGMSVDSQTEQRLYRRLGVRPLPALDGLAALGAAMASAHPQIVVLHGDAAKIERVLAGGGDDEEKPRASAPSKPAAPGPEPADTITAVTGLFAELLRVSPADLDLDGSLEDYGVDSIMMITIMNELEKRFGRSLPPSVLNDYPSVSALAGFLDTSRGDSAGVRPDETNTREAAPAGREPLGSVSRGRVPAPSRSHDQRIAIIGMSCRFPQSPSLGAYWQNLLAGRNLVREVPEGRWDAKMFFSEDKEAAFKSYAKWGGFVDGIDLFDAGFFGISDRDALSLDPQHRLLLELAQELFDHAGYKKSELGGKRIGVTVGAAEGRYLISNLRHLAADQSGRMVVNTGQNMMAARITDFFNLKGAAKSVDTACSSSMMAVHDVCQALLVGDLEMAVAGGVHLLVDESEFVGFSKARVLSDDGCCYVFDERAKGFVLGEGAGLVLLKRYEDALRDGDRVLGVILASAANNDGHTAGLTVPSLEGQREVIEAAVAKSGVDPATIGYLEAHGTGTLLGDPIEIKAASEVYGRFGSRRQYCAVGSVKSNMGHLMQASGAASLIKLVLSLGHGMKPPTLHCRKPHPRFRFAETPFYPILEARAWPDAAGPRRGAVSSFGFGGTNIHAILEEHAGGSNGRPALPPTRFQRKRYWLGREIVAEKSAAVGFDPDRVLSLLRGLKSGAVTRNEAVKALNF